MDRRKFVLGMGSLAAGGAAAMGTGAFDSATIEDRDFQATVRVDNHTNQVLRLQPNSQYSTIDGNGELQVEIDALAQNSQYTFTNLFRVVNQGREDVTLQVNVTDDVGGAITGVPAENNNGATRSDVRTGQQSILLESGGWVELGGEVDVGDGTGTFDGEFTIIAD